MDFDGDGDSDANDGLILWLLLDSNGRFSWPSFVFSMILLCAILMAYHYWG